MSLVVMGMSHRSTPIDVLERVALDADGGATLAQHVLRGENVSEAVVVATCNRLEVYAEVNAFHGSVDDIGAALVAATGMSRSALADHCYVHYEDRAIAHVFQLACGLDSMAVGEPQILGQLRASLESARGAGTAGPALNALFQQALRVGKRAHAETDIDRAGRDLISEGLAAAIDYVGPLSAAHVLVIGAGAMSGLAATTIARGRPASLTIVNRTWAKSQRLAQDSGGRPLPWDELHEAFVDADVVLTCTGSLGYVVKADALAEAAESAPGRASRRAIIDLALPRDVDPDVALLPNTRLVGLAEIGERLAARADGAGVGAVRDLITAEVAAYLVARRGQEVGPTVAALRTHAADVVAAELARLDAKAPGMDDLTRAEVQLTIHRVVEKLLHTPTVRVKQLTGADGADYARALRELFDLDPGSAATSGATPSPGVTR
ncbi:glutamyl-tRNA reductase [Piscicoccus intestinalis]|uniref:glutamyl-tRNA reductase n=1 Tax=Piscicoccus intestinalis TaxID=746033 RepID=UPI00083834A0|nr:glutamyl-tRNA reductase [Piscicoccus intestinalis]